MNLTIRTALQSVGALLDPFGSYLVDVVPTPDEQRYAAACDGQAMCADARLEWCPCTIVDARQRAARSWPLSKFERWV